MLRTLFPVSVTAILLASCSSASYKVNPPSVAVEEPQIAREIPESQRDGYMRIVGDLRWDQLTSTNEWMARFPECLNDQWRGVKISKIHLTNRFWIEDPETSESRWVYKDCKNFSPGSIPVSVKYVNFVSNSGTESKTMTRIVGFKFFDDSQRRAFKAAISQKYSYTSDGYCSKYTCWTLRHDDAFFRRFPYMPQGGISAQPTSYTISLLDQVQVNASDL